MEQQALMDALVQAKRMNNLLNEVMEISRQLAEAMDRDDQVSIQLLIGMRQEPIDKMALADQALQQQLADLTDPEEARHFGDLLRGGEAKTAEEEPLAKQFISNRRLLKEVIELDKMLNRKLTREESFYNESK